MTCYRSGGCGPYENRSCNECPASKKEYGEQKYGLVEKLMKTTKANKEQCEKAIRYCATHPEISILEYLESKGLV